jgi:hypothetical protein
MLTFITDVLISALSGILASIFKNTALAAVFKKASPEQEAVNIEEKMADAAVNTPDKAQTVKDLENGSI